MSDLFFHTHVHSEFSSLDALAEVPRMVRKARQNGQPAIALTDHGNISGTVQLYKAAKKEGILPFPGMEGYLVSDTQDKDAQRYHIGLLALTERGYQGLVWLTSESYKRENLHRFPRFDWGDLRTLSEKAGDDIAVLTGCYFGLVQQTLVDKGPAAAKRIVQMYARMFPNTYVEVQDHNIMHPGGKKDSDIVVELVRIADSLGLPIIATQDSHYLDQNDKAAHELMKRTVYGSAEDTFPGDSFHLSTTEWVRDHYTDDVWAKAQQGYSSLLDKHAVALKPLDTFKVHVPMVSHIPDTDLAAMSYDRLQQMGLDKPKYRERLEHELDVIRTLGVANYFLMWDDIVTWGRSKQIMMEARGSANGSLVNYVNRITSVDPINRGLLFERFLSVDRIKPPDVDMDVEDIHRPRVIAYIMRRYPSVQIGTYSKLGARVDPETGEERGSVIDTYKAGLKRVMGDEKYKKEGWFQRIKTLDDVKRHFPQDYVALRRLAQTNARKSIGVHAAGVLLDSDTQPLADWVPTMLVASSDTTVTQYMMDDVEEFGYLKNDILGVRYLTVLKRAQELIGRPDPLDFSWIPDDDRKACAIARSGRANTGVFQFDGYSMAKGGRLLGVKNTNDFITAGALFRPALTKRGMDLLYIERRNDASLRSKVKYPGKAFEDNLKTTYGIVLYQEQVIQIMRDLGMDVAGINVFFKLVKDSGAGSQDRNEARIRDVQQKFADICKANGIKDVKGAWSYIEGYVQYGFNKSHSTGYGIRGYRGAYLKAHYPLEFMSALLEMSAGSSKEREYVREARHMGIRILPPDVNVSGNSYTLDRKRKAIRRGLRTIKGIGDATAESIIEEREASGEYADIDDFVSRLPGRKCSGSNQYMKDQTFTGNLETLRVAGALESLGVER